MFGFTPENCYRHSERPASAVCGRCRRPICDQCAAQVPGSGPLCAPCLTELEWRYFQDHPTAYANPFRAPLGRPLITYALIGVIGLIWAAMELAGGSQTPAVLVRFGALYGPLILREGQVWRLLTAMFLHIGVLHLLFNSWALYVLGRDMEMLYGRARFAVIYLLAGLFGSLTTFALKGPQEFSAGASGAVFGVVGMNAAFFYFHRTRLGEFGKARMQQTIQLILINLIIGFSVVSINNAAHLGGLAAGAALGYLLVPRHRPRGLSADGDTLEYDDLGSLERQKWVVAAAAALLIGGVWAALQFWLGRLTTG